MNKFSIIGTRAANGRFFFITSEKAPLELVLDVLKITHEDVKMNIFKGHIESEQGLIPQELLTLVQLSISWLKGLDSEDIVLSSIRNRISRLQKYIEATNVVEHKTSDDASVQLVTRSKGVVDTEKTVVSIGGFQFEMTEDEWDNIKKLVINSKKYEASIWFCTNFKTLPAFSIKIVDTIEAAINSGAPI